jgi:hypothetical protein
MLTTRKRPQRVYRARWHGSPTIGLAVAYTRISDSARALHRDYQILASDPPPIRDNAILVTATCNAEIRRGWTVLPRRNTLSTRAADMSWIAAVMAAEAAFQHVAHAEVAADLSEVDRFAFIY